MNPAALDTRVSDGITGNPPPVVEKPAGTRIRIRCTSGSAFRHAFQRSTTSVNQIILEVLISGAGGKVETVDLDPPVGKVFRRITTH